MSLFKREKDEYKETKGRLERTSGCGSNYIEVTLPDGKKRHLYEDIVTNNAKDLSPNERKKVIADCEEQIDSLKGGDCPTIFREMLNELKYGELEGDDKNGNSI